MICSHDCFLWPQKINWVFVGVLSIHDAEAVYIIISITKQPIKILVMSERLFKYMLCLKVWVPISSHWPHADCFSFSCLLFWGRSFTGQQHEQQGPAAASEGGCGDALWRSALPRLLRNEQIQQSTVFPIQGNQLDKMCCSLLWPWSCFSNMSLRWKWLHLLWITKVLEVVFASVDKSNAMRKEKQVSKRKEMLEGWKYIKIKHEKEC